MTSKADFTTDFGKWSCDIEGQLAPLIALPDEQGSQVSDMPFKVLLLQGNFWRAVAG